MIGPAYEQVQAGNGTEGFGDAVTFAFGDSDKGLYGSARLGLVPGEPPRASALALLFAEGDVAAAEIVGGAEVAQANWDRLDVGDLSTTTVEPLHAWEVVFDGDEGGFELRFEALGPPAEVGAGRLAASAADLHGYEQLCRVRGTVRVGERRTTVDCVGQRGHQWGSPDWDRLALARTLSAWFDDGDGVALASVRPADATGHDEELTNAFLLASEDAVAIGDPRLSTTSDGQGRQHRAGLELWLDGEDELGPRRLTGQAVCGTTLDLGRLRLDCAFFTWRMEGRQGVGRYDVLRRA